MCRMVRELSPHSTIIVGGHVTATPDIEHVVDADHYVRGEGISWMRRYLAKTKPRPSSHPAIVSGIQTPPWACAFPSAAVPPPPRSFPRSVVPWVAALAPHPRSSVQGQFLQFLTKPATSSLTSWRL